MWFLGRDLENDYCFTDFPTKDTFAIAKTTCDSISSYMVHGRTPSEYVNVRLVYITSFLTYYMFS